MARAVHFPGPAAAFLGACLALYGAAAGAKSFVPAYRYSEDNILVLEVRVGGEVIAPALTAYQKGAQILLPLGALARLLSLAIEVDTESAVAAGFVLLPERRLELDVERATVRLAQGSFPVDPDQVFADAEDIYVSTTLLARWLPIDLQVDPDALALIISAREPLPFQLRQQRRSRAVGLQAAAPEAAAGYWRHDSPYRWLETPFVDLTLAADAVESPATSGADGRYALFATGDLLKMESALAAVGGPSTHTLRATLSRHDPRARLLGPLGARAISVGSVAVPGTPNVLRTQATGYGGLLSNRPLTQAAAFDRHSLQGELPPGWDVELYANGALIGFQESSLEGRYAFDDLPLLYGYNEFRLLFHGPQGQTREQIQTFLLEDSLAPPGEVLYRLAAHRDDAGQPRVLAQTDLGLARGLTLSGGWTHGAVYGAERRYAFGGLRAAVPGWFFNADLVQADDGGRLGELGLRTRWRGYSLGLAHAELSGFVSDYFAPLQDPVRAQERLRLDGPLAPALLPSLRLGVNVARERHPSGAPSLDASARFSAYVNGTSLSHETRVLEQGALRTVDGSLQASHRMAAIRWRGQVQYALAPSDQLTAVGLSGDRSFGRGYLFSADVTHGLLNSETLCRAGLNKAAGAYALGLTASYSTREELRLGLQLFFSAGRDPWRGTWITDAQPLADSGAVAARVFVDHNLNARRDAGEPPVAGAGFRINGASPDARTDAQGLAFLPRLPPRQVVHLGIDAETLEDPQWLPYPAGLHLAPRSGHVAVLDLPVVVTGEIEGTVYAQTRHGARGVPGVELELQNRRGDVLQRVRTDADGFYVLSSVPPGDHLVVSPEHVGRGLRADTGIHPVRMSNAGDIRSGVDLLLESAASRKPPVSPAAPASTPTPTKAEGRRYVVKKGDWLWKIAERMYGVASNANVDRIRRANAGVLAGSDHLQPNQVLFIPPMDHQGPAAIPQRTITGSRVCWAPRCPIQDSSSSAGSARVNRNP